MREQIDGSLPQECHVEVAIGVIGGRWKLAIVKVLSDDPMRYSEIRKSLPGITQRMLSRQLGELETDGIILRTVVADTPPAVWYALTRSGRELTPITDLLDKWGRSYAESVTGPDGERT